MRHSRRYGIFRSRSARRRTRICGAGDALARHYGLTAYAAAYLALALRRRVPLATNDAHLCAAARDLKVDLIAA